MTKQIAKQAGFTLIKLFLSVLLIAGMGGWIANIVKLAGMHFEPITTILVIRVVGIFVPPVGAVMGFL